MDTDIQTLARAYRVDHDPVTRDSLLQALRRTGLDVDGGVHWAPDPQRPMLTACGASHGPNGTALLTDQRWSAYLACGASLDLEVSCPACLSQRQGPLTRHVLCLLAYGTTLYAGLARQARGHLPLRVRITGKAKEWKRDLSRWYVPVKHGMYDSCRIGCARENTAGPFSLNGGWYLTEAEADAAYRAARLAHDRGIN